MRRSEKNLASSSYEQDECCRQSKISFRVRKTRAGCQLTHYSPRNAAEASIAHISLSRSNSYLDRGWPTESLAKSYWMLKQALCHIPAIFFFFFFFVPTEKFTFGVTYLQAMAQFYEDLQYGQVRGRWHTLIGNFSWSLSSWPSSVCSSSIGASCYSSASRREIMPTSRTELLVQRPWTMMKLAR